MQDIDNTPTHRFVLLVLNALTNALVIAVPVMALSVLFQEISDDLDLTVVQVGMLWGIGALPGIVTSLLGGMLGDRFGPKRVLIVGYLLIGLTGAMRGLASDFTFMMVAVSLFGAAIPLAIINAIKLYALWFPPRQLGLANGVLSTAMAFGFILGTILSATWLSPLLGGWRQVMVFLGAIGVVAAIPWFFLAEPPAPAADDDDGVPMQRAFGHVAGLRDIWLLGLVGLSVAGANQGLTGYLPLHLRGLGWSVGNADAAVALFHTASMFFTLPIALWAVRHGTRRQVLSVAGLLLIAGLGLLAFVDGAAVWVAVALAGMVRDGFMAVYLTLVVQTDGVGPKYAGTATGLIMVLVGVGNLLAPPVGNAFGSAAPGLPFAFWAVLAFGGLAVLQLVSDRRKPGVLAASAA